MTASLPFTNKIIIITGAGSGIGKATAIKLSTLGATLAITDITSSSLEKTLSLCTPPAFEKHEKHFTSVFDVGKTEPCNEFILNVVEKLGRVDHVFNCAGVNPTDLATAEITDEYWDKLINTNLKGLFNITRAAIPHMPSGSTFVNTSSIKGLGPGSGFAVYCASKYGIIGFSKSVALELGSKGIRTNIIAPGYIDTPTNASVVAGPESVARAAAMVSSGRLGTPEEVADVVVFLMSEESRYMNGSVVEIHGGMKL
ncbi:NAD(P)-binding Rossmann-fold containing protein [Glarea lozoyensis ATCC 20868]|uniref:NAD(P)-binding Rossmann-fold containing protein n=1 Tax=Glarea lozoyensis (strain ATCC 20868 / MF5171) TaxID=1116229 RepID=S3CGJ0_GLAL2|nr:NAD(P)-binding Rossmann-fold containing protein [Glarea lozoyensis ATCC 20868]EPE25020.1 NAD(P)-binding Rossmann-fold containing protein [Glarea lozoyensis ATCC 20868]